MKAVAAKLGRREGRAESRAIGSRSSTATGRVVRRRQYALHKAPVKGAIPVSWVRDGKEQSGTLEVADGWRKTNLTWRPSMLDILPSAPFSGDELTAREEGAGPRREARRDPPGRRRFTRRSKPPG